MPKFRAYRAVDASFLDAAPVRGTLQQVLPVSAEAAFRCLEDPAAWPQWLDAIKRVEWTSPKPFGVGTTRDVYLPGGSVSETFYAWEDGHRMAFTFTGGTIPIFDAFAEDYRLVAHADDECELVWRYGAGLKGMLRYADPLFAKGFATNGAKALRSLADYLRTNGAQYAA